MNHSLLATLIIITTSSYAQIKEPNPAPRVDSRPRPYAADPEKVYIPDGFDHLDNIQIIVEGRLPNSCHTLSGATAYIQADTLHIKVNATEYFGKPCMEMLIPYTHTIDVGLVPTGVYNVIVDMDEEFKSAGLLNVVTAKSIHPKPYAPVGGVEYRSAHFILSGVYTSACMRIEDVIVEIQNDIIVLLPILAPLDEKCLPSLREYEVVVPAPSLNHGKYLLYVRSANGQSVSKIIRD